MPKVLMKAERANDKQWAAKKRLKKTGAFPSGALVVDTQVVDSQIAATQVVVDTQVVGWPETCPDTLTTPEHLRNVEDAQSLPMFGTPDAAAEPLPPLFSPPDAAAEPVAPAEPSAPVGRLVAPAEPASPVPIRRRRRMRCAVSDDDTDNEVAPLLMAKKNVVYHC